MEEDLYRAIFERMSVRKFDGMELKEGVLSRLEVFLAGLRPLFPDIRTEFKVFGPQAVKGLFKVKAPYYLVAFSEEKEGDAANAGFMLQQVDLYLASIGLGACWQGSSKLNRSSRDVSSLEPVVLLAFGIPQGESRRHELGEFDRKPLSELTDIQDRDGILEAARLAPSAMNRQPWYFTTGELGSVNVYAARSTIMDRLNQVSAGIALCHMWLAASHAGLSVGFDREPDDSPSIPGHRYIATMVVKRHNHERNGGCRPSEERGKGGTPATI